MAPIEERTGAGFDVLLIKHESLEGADFSGRKLASLGINGSTLINCRFDRMVVDNMVFGHPSALTRFVGCSFDGSTLKAGGIDLARFESCSFERVKLSGWETTSVELVGCVFSGTLRDCTFDARVEPRVGDMAPRTRNEFSGNDFSNAKLHWVRFLGGIDLAAQSLPGGPDYLYLPDARRAYAEARSWAEAEHPEFAGDMGAVLGSVEYCIGTGQNQVLLRTAEMSRRYKHLVPLVVEFWRERGLLA